MTTLSRSLRYGAAMALIWLTFALAITALAQEAYGQDYDSYSPFAAESYTHPQAALSVVQSVISGDSLLAVRYVGAAGEPGEERPDAAGAGSSDPDWLLVCYERADVDWKLHDEVNAQEVRSNGWVPAYVWNHFTYPASTWRRDGFRSATFCHRLLDIE